MTVLPPSPEAQPLGRVGGEGEAFAGVVEAVAVAGGGGVAAEDDDARAVPVDGGEGEGLAVGILGDGEGVGVSQVLAARPLPRQHPFLEGAAFVDGGREGQLGAGGVTPGGGGGRGGAALDDDARVILVDGGEGEGLPIGLGDGEGVAFEGGAVLALPPQEVGVLGLGGGEGECGAGLVVALGVLGGGVGGAAPDEDDGMLAEARGEGDGVRHPGGDLEGEGGLVRCLDAGGLPPQEVLPRLGRVRGDGNSVADVGAVMALREGQRAAHHGDLGVFGGGVGDGNGLAGHLEGEALPHLRRDLQPFGGDGALRERVPRLRLRRRDGYLLAGLVGRLADGLAVERDRERVALLLRQVVDQPRPEEPGAVGAPADGVGGDSGAEVVVFVVVAGGAFPQRVTAVEKAVRGVLGHVAIDVVDAVRVGRPRVSASPPRGF